MSIAARMRRLTLYFTKMVTVTSKGQITLPKASRELFGVKPGDRLILTVKGDEFWIRPLGPITRQTAGSLSRYARPRKTVKR